MSTQPTRSYTRLAVAVIIAGVVIGAGIFAASYFGTATTVTRSASSPGVIILPSSVVSSSCPNLPSANQLLSNSSQGGLQVFGRTSAQAVQNYSETVLDYMNGQTYPDWVVISVTNGTVWVVVPEPTLIATGCLASLSNYIQSESGPSTTA
jgi:hypothetical protein